MSLPNTLYQADHVRQLDRIAIDEYGTPGIELMERAGQAAWDLLLASCPDIQHVCVVCGVGNNAGDGYIVARLAAEHGIPVQVLSLVDIGILRGDAKLAVDRLQSKFVSIQQFKPDFLAEAEVVVDALFGTGLDRDVVGVYAEAIHAINVSHKPVLALDIPSGINADTGCVMGAAVKADWTISFVGLKQGMFTGEAPEYCGQVCFSELGIEQQVYSRVPNTPRRIEWCQLTELLPKRSRIAHKGNYGHVLVIGGDYGFMGAARLASESTMRTGAGLVTLATRERHAIAAALAFPEVMTCAVECYADLQETLAKATVLAIGPGLGQTDWAIDLLAGVLQSPLPIVIDADALNLLAQQPSHSDHWILTPHPGEAARLLGVTTREVQADRFAAVTALQEKYGGVIVLKGCGTLIADREGKLSLCSTGNPGMATGGMGDVLTGVISGLLAQGLTLEQAADLGVCIHAAAADKAARHGQRGLIASNLFDHFQSLLNPSWS